MKTGEYETKEMKALLDSMSGMYDLARIVDPIECRILELDNDGNISMNNSCYGIWNSENKCVNCSSAIACKTGCHQEKAEFFNDQIYHIHSNPVKLRLPDGGLYDAVVELVSIKNESDEIPLKKINDRESENKKDKSILYRAKYDDLTGILKADAFFESARELLAKSGCSSWKMVMGDIIDFRLFNSLFGVEKGNEVLLKTAETLSEIADENSGLCSRLYRDKFAVLIPSEKYRENTFKKAAKDINAAFSTGAYTLRIHFGIYDIKNSDIPISVMCDRANMALRSIESSYRSSIAYFDNKIMQKSIDEQKIISAFETALEEDQFKMYLQPLTKYDGQLFGAEALVRWILPDGTVVPPGDFINTLENAGLIHKLDIHIWEQAIKQLKNWENTVKENLTISVNMSAKDFYSIDIYKTLTNLTKKYNVENRKLRLEITESTLIENPKNIYPVISKLQKAGFLVEIDDFGKGYSSLSLLKDIKADILKIDMGLVHEIESEKRSRIILKSVIAMAKELGMQVITEGVETEPQLKALTSMGCDYFQGFYFSKPIMVDEFELKYV